MPTQTRTSSPICLQCALCCNGALFADVKLRAQDDALELIKSGVKVRKRGAQQKLMQPCAALGCDNRCRVYARRPLYCRQFECALLKKLRLKKVSRHQAEKIIRRAHRQLARVEKLFRKLGDANRHLALKPRFFKLARRMAAAQQPPEVSATYADLTLALHDLHLLLAREFYPGG